MDEITDRISDADIISALLSEREQLKRWLMRFAERILAAHEVIAKFAERPDAGGADVEVWAAILSALAQSRGHPKPVAEYRFHPERMWRFDLAWPTLMVAFEKEGMARPGGKSRHATKDGYAKDCEKYNAAQLAGWVVIRGTARMIESGEAGVDLLAALELASGRAATLEEKPCG